MKFRRQTDDRSMIERCKTGTLHAIWHNLGAVSRHSLFDTVVVDGLVLSVWRPGFLQLPNKDQAFVVGRTMRRDIMKTRFIVCVKEATSPDLGWIAEASISKEPGAGKTCPERSRRAARRDTSASSVQVCAGAVG